MYDRYSLVEDSGDFKMATWRDTVLARRVSRKIIVQANAQYKGELSSLYCWDEVISTTMILFNAVAAKEALWLSAKGSKQLFGRMF